MNFNIIGTGRLGKNIALALSKAHIASLDSICNQTLESAVRSSKELGMGMALDSFDHLPMTDIIWLTCNDDSIQPVVNKLKKTKLLKKGSYVIHCSGVLNSSVLAPLKEQGCLTASFHPLKAFRNGYLDAQAFHNVDCVTEGDEEVCSWLRTTFSSLGSHVITIKTEAKASYHAAACLASNYLITLASCSEELLLKSGLTQEDARRITCKLMLGNIHNLENIPSIAQSLTGPLMRGDVGTLELHLQAMDNAEMKQLYKSAGIATLPLTQLTDEKKLAIKSLFETSTSD